VISSFVLFERYVHLHGLARADARRAEAQRPNPQRFGLRAILGPRSPLDFETSSGKLGCGRSWLRYRDE
jgi:hypothetical protein